MSESRNIPCEMIRDLFPSYIDRLTSDVTNREIEAHTAGCPACAEVLAAMRNPEAEPSGTADASQTKEIDFLRKNKRRNLKIIIGSIAGALALAMGILALRVFVIGDMLYGDWIACRVQVSGCDIVLDGSPIDSIHGIAKVIFEEKDGIVTATTRAVIASPLHTGNFHAEYTAEQPVRQVRINDRILWADGDTISSFVSAVYETRHDYMGSMSDNNRTANALNLSGYLGEYTNELHTSSTPYAWHIKLSEPITGENRIVREDDMQSFGCILLGVIGNLDEVVYEYTADGEAVIKTVTKEDASAYLGQNIKNCGTSIRVLNALIQKTGLDTYTFSDAHYFSDDPDTQILLFVVNASEEPLQCINYAIYNDGQLQSSGGMLNADESPIKPGDMTPMSFPTEIFGYRTNGSELTLAFSVETTDGKTFNIDETIRIPSQPGASGRLEIVGNSKDGFGIRQ